MTLDKLYASQIYLEDEENTDADIPTEEKEEDDDDDWGGEDE